MGKPAHTCHYLTFSKASSEKIYELVGELLGEKHSDNEKVRHELAQEIESWANANTCLQRELTTTNYQPDFCAESIRVHKEKLLAISIARKFGVNIEQLEELILNWFEESFVKGEEKCAVCTARQ